MSELNQISKTIYGYFTESNQIKPAYDPGLEVDCPFCNQSLSEPIVSTSVMPMEGGICYFYRAHKECLKNASPGKIGEIDSVVFNEGNNIN